MELLKYLIFGVLLILSFGCNGQQNKNQKGENQALLNYNQLDTATFAGGCFWCVEAAFDQISGVEEAVSGYAGGEEENPTYSEVSGGQTSHTETVEIYFDPEEIDYTTLLDIFFTAHDPTQLNRQGPDIGKQYRSAIFYHNEEQKKLAEEKMKTLDASGEYDQKVVTELVPYTEFWIAEDYHQDYEKHHPKDSYILNVSKPKIDKVAQKFAHLLKEN
ncbi:MAG: peptide-methionine (S)-S-oxide reductase MsrA [Anditalea sp.]